MKYSTHLGEIEKWEQSDIDAMIKCREFYGDSAFLADFSRYGVIADELRCRYPKAKIIRVVGFETEDHDLPLRTDVVF